MNTALEFKISDRADAKVRMRIYAHGMHIIQVVVTAAQAAEIESKIRRDGGIADCCVRVGEIVKCMAANQPDEMQELIDDRERLLRRIDSRALAIYHAVVEVAHVG